MVGQPQTCGLRAITNKIWHLIKRTQIFIIIQRLGVSQILSLSTNVIIDSSNLGMKVMQVTPQVFSLIQSFVHGFHWVGGWVGGGRCGKCWR